jgi:hypothetical protein
MNKNIDLDQIIKIKKIDDQVKNSRNLKNKKILKEAKKTQLAKALRCNLLRRKKIN